jgi:hypothetical protein
VSDADAYLREIAERGYRPGDEPRFRAAYEQLEAAYLDRICIVTEPFGEWRERFRAGATETVRLVEAFPREARFLAVDALAAGELGQRCHRDFAERLVELVETVRAELPDPGAVPSITGAWIVAMFFDRVYRSCTPSDGSDLSSELPELLFLAISAYFGTQAGLEELIRDR